MGPAELLELAPGYHLPGEGRIGLEGGVMWLLSSPAFSPTGVGKSSLLLRFADNTFSGECTPGVLLWCLVLKSLSLVPERTCLCLMSETLSFPLLYEGRRSGGEGGTG